MLTALFTLSPLPPFPTSAAAVETIEGEGEEEGEGPEFLSVDGVRLDPASLRAVDAKGKPMAISRLTVREMRAELTARRQPLYGNKKELTARLEVCTLGIHGGGGSSGGKGGAGASASSAYQRAILRLPP